MKSFYFPSFDHHVTVSEHTAAELIAASRGHKVEARDLDLADGRG